jgi:hypothetical protein
VLDGEPFFGEVGGVGGDGNRAGGEGSAEAGGGDVGAEEAVNEGGFSGAGAAEDRDEHGAVDGFVAEVEANGFAVGSPAIDGHASAAPGFCAQ